MNIVAGLEPFDSGTVTMHGEDIVGPGPERGVIFQQYALFPWMSVQKILNMVLNSLQRKMKKQAKQENIQKVKRKN